MAVLALIVFWVACGILSAMVASSKGRDAIGWFILGVVLGPLALLASVGMSAQNTEQAEASNADHNHEWEDAGEVMGDANPVVLTQKCLTCGMVRSKPHEHEWVDADSTDQVGSDAVKLKRCKACGLVEEKHEHRWGHALPNEKYAGRLHQRCANCDAARYIDAPISEVEADHEHRWATGSVAHPTDPLNVLIRLCDACGLVEPRPHEHIWGDPLPSGKHEGRLYQECIECKTVSYVN